MEHKSNWVPSVRLRNLMAKKGFIPVAPMPTAMLAHVWLDRHRALFASPDLAQRIITIIRYRYSATTINELRTMIAQSYIENHRVRGDLANVRNMGEKSFEALRDVVGRG